MHMQNDKIEMREREREREPYLSKASSRGGLHLVSLTEVGVVCVEHTSRKACSRNHLIVLIQPKRKIVTVILAPIGQFLLLF